MDELKLTKRINKIKKRSPSIIGSEQFGKYSIFLPIIKVNHESHILFEIRSKKLRRQPGEICFPGGRIDQNDKTSQEAAIRETCEELGLKNSDVQLLGALDYIASPFGTLIYPYFGYIHTNVEQLLPNSSEVDSIFTIPVSYLLQTNPEIYRINFDIQPEKDFPFHLIPGGENYNWRPRAMEELFYYYENKTVWGLTARVLHHFINLLKS